MKSIIETLPAEPGVYLITNKKNGFSYVGSAGTQGIKHRLRQHVYQLRNGKHHSPLFQRHWNKYGPKAFTVKVLVLCPIKEAKAQEQEVIDETGVGYKNKSYNVMDSVGRTHLTKGMRKKLRKTLRCKDLSWSSNRSGFRGVCFYKRDKNWKASIHRNGKSYHVGYFNTKLKARRAYLKAFSLPDRGFMKWFKELRTRVGGGQKGDLAQHAKLTNADARKMRKMYASGKYTHKDLTEVFGVQNISRILSGKSYPE